MLPRSYNPADRVPEESLLSSKDPCAAERFGSCNCATTRGILVTDLLSGDDPDDPLGCYIHWSDDGVGSVIGFARLNRP